MSPDTALSLYAYTALPDSVCPLGCYVSQSSTSRKGKKALLSLTAFVAITLPLLYYVSAASQ